MVKTTDQSRLHLATNGIISSYQKPVEVIDMTGLKGSFHIKSTRKKVFVTPSDLHKIWCAERTLDERMQISALWVASFWDCGHLKNAIFIRIFGDVFPT